jgi:hypothetical protein
MTEEIVNPLGFSENKSHGSEWKRFRRVFFSRAAVIGGLVILVILFAVAIFAPLLAPYDPYLPFAGPSLAPPSAEHWLGADKLGRDTLSRLIFWHPDSPAGRFYFRYRGLYNRDYSGNCRGIYQRFPKRVHNESCGCDDVFPHVNPLPGYRRAAR